MIEAIDQKKTLQFNGMNLENGKVYFNCVDLFTLDWVKEVVKNVPVLWENSKIKLEDQIGDRRAYISGIFPGQVLENEKILKKLEGQNETISTKDWAVQDSEPVTQPIEGVKLIIEVDGKSLINMMSLHMKLFYDFSCVTFKSADPPKKDDGNKADGQK